MGWTLVVVLRYNLLRMKKNVALTVLAVLLAGCQAGDLGFYLFPQAASTGISEVNSEGPLAGLEVVGYLPAYKIPTLDPLQARHLTELVYFTLSARADGEVRRGSLTAQHLDFLKKVKREFGTRILIGITDHDRRGALATVARSPVLRAKFAAQLTAFLTEQGFDGADFDWEYPWTSDLGAYAALLQEVKLAFSPRGLRLSVAVSPSHPLSQAGYNAVDRVHGMLYDDYGRHSTLERSSAHVEAFLEQGVPAEKLLLGVPFYGRGYTSSGPAWSSAVSYKTLRGRYPLAPGQDTVSGYYFNGVDTVRRKVQYAKAAGLSGVMVWEIGQDTTDGSSLLGAISDERRDLSRLN